MNETTKILLTPAAIVIAGLMISGSILASGGFALEGDKVGALAERAGEQNGGSGSSGGQENSDGGEEGLIPRVQASDHTQGASEEEAEITIVEYFDFQCHFCARVHPVLERVVSNISGVRWVMRDFPIFGAEPAVAAECVAKLGSEANYYDFSKALLNNQQQIGRDYFEQLATGYGISEAQYSQCLSSQEIQDEVREEGQQAKNAGGGGTPFSVIINEKTGKMYPLEGALRYEAWKSRINEIRS